MLEREDAFGWEVRDGAADVEGLFVGSFAREAEVGELDARVWTRCVQKDVLRLQMPLVSFDKYDKQKGLTFRSSGPFESVRHRCNRGLTSMRD